MCQHLLFALFFCSEYGAEMDRLKAAYDPLHAHLSRKYGLAYDPKDFEEALRILEGGFIVLSGNLVSFVNPSLRDYLTGYLTDRELLRELALTATHSDWARALWRHGTGMREGASIFPPAERREFALAFANVAKSLPSLPVWRKVRTKYGYQLHPIELSNVSRLKLLLDWFGATDDRQFLNMALQLAGAPVEGFDGWRDGEDAVELLANILDGDLVDDPADADEMAVRVEREVISMIRNGPGTEHLESISDAIDNHSEILSKDVHSAIERAIRDEFDNLDNVISDIDSESTLNDHIATLEKLGERIQLPRHTLQEAAEAVRERISEIEEQTSVSEGTSFRDIAPRGLDKFDDVALKNLFAPLLEQ